MQVLGLNGEIFFWLNLHPTNRFSGKMKYLPVASATIVLTVEVSALMSTSEFIRQNHDTKLADCAFALLASVIIFSVLYMWIVAYNIRTKLVEICTKFQELHDKSKLFRQ